MAKSSDQDGWAGELGEMLVPGAVGVAAGQVGQGAAGLEEPGVGAVADQGLGDVALADAGPYKITDSSTCSQGRAARSRIWAAGSLGEAVKSKPSRVTCSSTGPCGAGG